MGELLNYKEWNLLNEEVIPTSPINKLSSGISIANSLIKRGFTKEEASAICGNMWAESKFDPSAKNPNGAFGLLQWLGDRKKKLLVNLGKNLSNISIQLDFIKSELKEKGSPNDYEGKMFRKAMTSGKTVEDKAYYFAKYCERPSPGQFNASIEERKNAAKEIYNSLK
jgi:hypothetical protein